jgi:hypothetical protein
MSSKAGVLGESEHSRNSGGMCSTWRSTGAPPGPLSGAADDQDSLAAAQERLVPVPVPVGHRVMMARRVDAAPGALGGARGGGGSHPRHRRSTQTTGSSAVRPSRCAVHVVIWTVVAAACMLSLLCPKPGPKSDHTASGHRHCQWLVPMPVAVQAAVSAGERQALVDLYTATGGSSWTTKTGWTVGDPCTGGPWYGVECNAANTAVT